MRKLISYEYQIHKITSKYKDKIFTYKYIFFKLKLAFKNKIIFVCLIQI